MAVGFGRGPLSQELQVHGGQEAEQDDRVQRRWGTEFHHALPKAKRAIRLMKPVLYLDVDGVLWDFRYPEDTPQGAAKGVRDFIDFALEHFDVRWLTYWAPEGLMAPQGLRRLSRCTGVPQDVWSRVGPSRGFFDTKAEGIAWNDHKAGLPFVWVDDDPEPWDLEILRKHDAEAALFITDVLADPNALLKTTARLRIWMRAR